MEYYYQNSNSQELIVFFAGWGCDYNQFTNLHDRKDVLILYDYQDLELKFDFAKYANIYVIAYSAGVFIASVLSDKIPNLRKKIAVCGNPYLFDKKLGISSENIRIFKDINLNNYREFRRQYMVFSEDEYERYNKLESLRTIESCQAELTALQGLYAKHKNLINPTFDKAIIAENDLIFNLAAQKDFYQNKIHIIKNAKHHVFFKYNSFEDMLDI